MAFSLWCYLAGNAYQFQLDGVAANKYPVVIEVDRYTNGAIYGRYAYKSTLNRQGRDDPSSWLYIRPRGDSKNEYIITDSEGGVQEVWSNAFFWRNCNVNFFDVAVLNAKGNSFGIFARSSSKNTSVWSGTYSIYSYGYRSLPPIAVRITLSQNGPNSYIGELAMRLAEEDNNNRGLLFGNVTGTTNGNVLILKMENYHTVKGQNDDFFGEKDAPLFPGSTIAIIKREDATSYSIQPEGNMSHYLKETGGALTIVKIE